MASPVSSHRAIALNGPLQQFVAVRLHVPTSTDSHFTVYVRSTQLGGRMIWALQFVARTALPSFVSLDSSAELGNKLKSLAESFDGDDPSSPSP